MEAMISLGKELEMTAITLEVREGNAPAIALYRRYGFFSCGLRKNYYKNPPDNAMVMWFEFPLQ